ncbi:MAG: DcaP family trimeric outer membrane transporter [Myxococcota bacterium]
MWLLLLGAGQAAVVARADEGGKLDFPETPEPEADVDQRRLGTEASKPLNLRAPNLDWGVGGKVQLDVIYDVNAVGLEPDSGFYREFVTGQIPIAGPAAERTGRIGFSPNQSRLYGYVGTPTRWGPFRAYVQINLFRNSTTTDIQVHRLFAHWAWLHIAYDYSQFLNVATIPNTLDYEGPNAIPETRRGLGFLRIPLARLGRSNGFYFAVGAEEAGVEAVLPTDVVSRDKVPAVIARLIYAAQTTDLQVSGLYRRLQFSGGGFDTKTNGWGISFQGAVGLLDRDEAIAGVIYGKALGSYFQDTGGLGLDAAPDGDVMRAIRGFGAWIGYTHYWIATLSSTATFGYVYLDNNFDETPNPVGTYHETLYASMNLIWTPWHPMDVGVEYLFGQRTVTANTAVLGETSNLDHRLQFSFMFKFEVSRKGVTKMMKPATFRP